MFNTYFYNSSIRSLIVGFGQLFTDISIVRLDGNDKQVSNIPVPISYGPREKWLIRQEGDPELSRNVMNILPRIAFSMVGLQYDSERKLNMNQKIRFNLDAIDTSKRESIYTPVPYNVEFQLDIMGKTNNDVLQIVEQILPYFTPHYNITVKPLPSTDLVQDVPITLNSIQFMDSYNQEWSQERYVLYTLLFTAKTVIYGGIGKSSIIKNVTANIEITDHEHEKYNAYINPSSAGPNDEYSIIENWYDQHDIDTLFN